MYVDEFMSPDSLLKLFLSEKCHNNRSNFIYVEKHVCVQTFNDSNQNRWKVHLNSRDKQETSDWLSGSGDFQVPE